MASCSWHGATILEKESQVRNCQTPGSNRAARLDRHGNKCRRLGLLQSSPVQSSAIGSLVEASDECASLQAAIILSTLNSYWLASKQASYHPSVKSLLPAMAGCTLVATPHHTRPCIHICLGRCCQGRSTRPPHFVGRLTLYMRLSSHG